MGIIGSHVDRTSKIDERQVPNLGARRKRNCVIFTKSSLSIVRTNMPSRDVGRAYRRFAFRTTVRVEIDWRVAMCSNSLLS
jgi:hypothetical protein